MAKSKSGGSRAYLRGRLGADVYSIGRDSQGKKQQVVRSLAETVANPQTLAQMRGRMIMSTVMQAASALNFIIDHSFDSQVGKQANISEFIRANYALVKADVAAHPSTGNAFGLNEYQQKGIQIGPWLISDGKAVFPSSITLGNQTSSAVISVTGATVGDLKKNWGLSSDEYITLVAVDLDSVVRVVRVRLTTTLADTTAITEENVASLFTQVGTQAADIELDGSTIIITLKSSNTMAAGEIISRLENGQYIHSRCVLRAEKYGDPSDTVLPTYPIGSQAFLNGGDVVEVSVQSAAAGTSGGSSGEGSLPPEFGAG